MRVFGECLTTFFDELPFMIPPLGRPISVRPTADSPIGLVSLVRDLLNLMTSDFSPTFSSIGISVIVFGFFGFCSIG